MIRPISRFGTATSGSASWPQPLEVHQAPAVLGYYDRGRSRQGELARLVAGTVHAAARVTQAGTRVSRQVRRSRWTDGSTHLWISRRRTPAPATSNAAAGSGQQPVPSSNCASL